MNFDIQWHDRLSLILILAKYADDSASFFFHRAVDITHRRESEW
jgi:predicted lipid carrier protein YhbT